MPRPTETRPTQRTHPQQAAVVDGCLGAEEHVEEQLQEGQTVLRRHEAVCVVGRGVRVVQLAFVWLVNAGTDAEAEAHAHAWRHGYGDDFDLRKQQEFGHQSAGQRHADCGVQVACISGKADECGFEHMSERVLMRL